MFDSGQTSFVLNTTSLWQQTQGLELDLGIEVAVTSPTYIYN